MKKELLDQNKTSQRGKKDGSPSDIEESGEAENKNDQVNVFQFIF